MTTLLLNDDVARCRGHNYGYPCIDCLRRIVPVSGDRAVMMEPPELVQNGNCEERIAP
jgi:hypothetical protein